MLSEQELQEIRAELAHYEHAQAASVEALKVVQRHRGWVSDEALREVAAVLQMSAEELDAVATFYNLIYRRPVGRHVIHVCDSVSCWVVGRDTVAAHLQQRLGIRMGQTTPDGRITLLPIVCLGACDRAPAMLVDRQLHGDLDPSRIDAILAGLEDAATGRQPGDQGG